MSWISDVKHDLGKLDYTIKSLRKFGITVGLVLIIFFAWFLYKDILPVFRLILFSLGVFLFLAGFFLPKILRNIYTVWMGLAFVLGWLVSRVILTILFFLVLTPVAFIAKIAGKKFIDTDISEGSKSYWVKKNNAITDYEKMF